MRVSPPPKRAEAAEMVRLKYRGRVLDFREADCIRMARTYLVKLGHRPPKLPKYTSLLGAKRALKDAGFDSIEALLDSILIKHRAPAFRQFGDLLLYQGDPEDGGCLEGGGLDSVAIYIGPKVMGWAGGRFYTDIIAPQVKAAYRA